MTARPRSVEIFGSNDLSKGVTTTDNGAQKLLDVNVAAGSITITAGQIDEAPFTEGTTPYAPIGGEFNDASPGLTAGQGGAVRLTQKRAAHANLRRADGTEIGTAAAPVRTDPTGTTTQPVSVSNFPSVQSVTYTELTSRMLNTVAAVGYQIWLDAGDTSFIYILEAPAGTAAGSTGFRGIRITLSSGSPVGEVQINVGATLSFSTRKTDGNWT